MATFRITATANRKERKPKAGPGLWWTIRQIPTFEVEACSTRNAETIARDILSSGVTDSESVVFNLDIQAV